MFCNNSIIPPCLANISVADSNNPQASEAVNPSLAVCIQLPKQGQRTERRLLGSIRNFVQQ
jgi:hypothetical protein